MLFSGVTLSFVKAFLLRVWLTAPLLLSIAMFITFIVQLAGKKEGWTRVESFYWSFITATTVGYGDMRQTKTASRMLAIVIALLGLTLTGIIVALAVNAATVALTAHDVPLRSR